MPPEPARKDDRASEMTPVVVPAGPWCVRDVQTLAGYKLAVLFVDETKGTVDMSALVKSPRAGVFVGRQDRILFERAYVHCGAVTWPGGLDLAPDAMYDEIKIHGEWKAWQGFGTKVV